MPKIWDQLFVSVAGALCVGATLGGGVWAGPVWLQSGASVPEAESPEPEDGPQADGEQPRGDGAEGVGETRPAAELPVGSEAWTREAKFLVEEHGGLPAEQAAFDLFQLARPEEDAYLRAVLSDETTYKPAARLSILGALQQAGRFRPLAGCEMVYAALAHTDPLVAAEALTTFTSLEHERTYGFVLTELTALRTQWAQPGTRRGRKALALVDVLERMRNPIRAVGVLITVLEYYPGRALEQKVREALQRMTARTFDSSTEWRRWYDQASKLSLAEWRSEVARNQEERLRRYEDETRRLFSQVLTGLRDDPEALLRELHQALVGDTVPAVRRTAVEWLGNLSQQGATGAVNLLKSQLTGTSTDYNEIKSLALRELGRARDAALIADIEPFLERRFHWRMRLSAVVALGRLQRLEAIPLLLRLLNDTSNPAELLEEVIRSLGEINHNPDALVSGPLVQFAEAHLLGRSNGFGPGASQLLKATATALGRLPLEPGAAYVEPVADLLIRLAGPQEEDANVRLFAVTALGRIPHSSVFLALGELAQSEAVPAHLLTAVIEAIGNQTRTDPTHVLDAVALLVPFLDHPGAGVPRKCTQVLARLCDDDAELIVRQRLVAEVLQRQPEDDAQLAPFLAGLPDPSAVEGEVRERALDLLVVRGRGYVLANPSLALSDARALLTQGRAAGAFDVVVRLVPQGSEVVETPDALAAWGLALEAASALRGANPEAFAPALRALQDRASAAPAGIQRRIEDLASQASDQ